MSHIVVVKINEVGERPVAADRDQGVDLVEAEGADSPLPHLLESLALLRARRLPDPALRFDAARATR